ncbi:uncharacterized protein TNCV_626611 [Trichonephila clavipes]|nr:uncharacterized protein TNCV_626611 [Trichonephila clavipes]
MRSIGKVAEAGRMFCGIMNLPQPPTRFSPYGKRILNAAKLVYEDSIQNAVKEAICENEGKEIDVDILSKYCTCKNLSFHEKDCKRNCVGPSGAREIQGASKIIQRSLSLHNACYITYLGDGDCKALDAVKVKKKNIYGNEYPIEKLDCINHIMKRMGARLRRLKAQLKGQILSDGKSLSGKNRLTEHEIDNLQSYYESVIWRNHSSVQNMRQAIWTIFLHKLSNDEYPQHGFCPIGEDSWCGFKKAEASEKFEYVLDETKQLLCGYVITGLKRKRCTVDPDRNVRKASIASFTLDSKTQAFAPPVVQRMADICLQHHAYPVQVWRHCRNMYFHPGPATGIMV